MVNRMVIALLSYKLNRFCATLVKGAVIGGLWVLATRLRLCLVVEEFKVVSPLVPFAVVFVLAWTGGDGLLRLWLEPLLRFLPRVDASGVLHSWLLEFLKSEVDVSLLVNV